MNKDKRVKYNILNKKEKEILMKRITFVIGILTFIILAATFIFLARNEFGKVVSVDISEPQLLSDNEQFDLKLNYVIDEGNVFNKGCAIDFYVNNKTDHAIRINSVIFNATDILVDYSADLDFKISVEGKELVVYAWNEGWGMAEDLHFLLTFDKNLFFQDSFKSSFDVIESGERVEVFRVSSNNIAYKSRDTLFLDFSLDYSFKDTKTPKVSETWEYRSNDYGEYGLQIKDGLFDMKAYGGPITEQEFVFLLSTNERNFSREAKIEHFPVFGNSIENFRTKLYPDKSCTMKFSLMLEIDNKFYNSDEYELVFIVPVSDSKMIQDGSYFEDERFSNVKRILYFPFGSDMNTNIGRKINDVHFYTPKVVTDNFDFNDFMTSREWAKFIYEDGFEGIVDTKNLEIDYFELRDLDRCEEEELLITAFDYTGITPFGISAVFKIIDNKPAKIISVSMSGGSIGGEILSIDYDKAFNRYVICKSGSAGGFGGRSLWAEYYIWGEDGLEVISSHSVLSQFKENYTDIGEYSINYQDNGVFWSDSNNVYTVYHVNNENVDEETYSFEVNRFIKQRVE